MGNKRKRASSQDRIERKIRRLEEKLRTRRKRIFYSSEDEPECLQEPPLNEEVSNIPSDYELLPPFKSASLAEPILPLHEQVLPTDFVPEPGLEPPAGEPSSTCEDVQLDDETLLLLGEAPEAETTFGKPVHKDLAARWLEILRKGLNKDTKDKLFKEYLIPSNCELLVPPLLNSEVKVALIENASKRDMSMAIRQKHLSVAVAALTQTIDTLLSKTEYQALKKDVLKPISDTCRILCDMHHFETDTRKKFVISSINNELKETLVNSTTDKLLFGENLSEKLRTAKNIQKSAEVLKVTNKMNVRSSVSFPSGRGNFRNLHQRRPDAARTQTASLTSAVGLPTRARSISCASSTARATPAAAAAAAAAPCLAPDDPPIDEV